MKTKLINAFSVGMLLLIPNLHFAQAPDLGAADSFAIFTAVGAVSNTGNTIIIGDVGTNAGAFTGFPPGIVNGDIHVADGVSAQAASDVIAAYTYLTGITCGPDPGAILGSGQILTPDVYCTVGAATLTGDLFLNGQGNPNALFIIKINGAFTSSASSKVVLINSASLCNVYWQINGAVALGISSVFKGTIVNNAAITLASSAVLMGRGLSSAGAIGMSNNNIVTSEPIHNINTGEYFCTLADAIADPQTINGNEIQIPSGIYTDPCTTINKSVILTAIFGSVSLDCIIINGMNINIFLGSDLFINMLSLTNGKIHTNGHNLSAGTITGGSSISYVVTD